MKKILNLVALFMRRNLAGSSLIMVGFPILMIVFVVLTSNDSTEAARTTVVNLDSGVRAAEVLAVYDAELPVLDNEAEARVLLEDQRTDNVFVFPADFSAVLDQGEVPVITYLQRPNSTVSDQAFALFLQHAVQTAVQQTILEEAGIEGAGDFAWMVDIEADRFTSQEGTAILLLTFSILYGSAILGTDLVNQRKNKVLFRGLATPTSGLAVMSSNVIGAWLVQLISNLIAIVIIAFFMDFTGNNLAVLILMVAILCFYSVSQQLLFLRLFKNPQLSMFIGMMLAVLMMFLAMLESMKDLITSLPALLYKLAYLSPFYWVMQAFEQDNPLLPAAMLLLLSVAIFVAGGFRIRQFAD